MLLFLLIFINNNCITLIDYEKCHEKNLDCISQYIDYAFHINFRRYLFD